MSETENQPAEPTVDQLRAELNDARLDADILNDRCIELADLARAAERRAAIASKALRSVALTLCMAFLAIALENRR